MTFLTATPPSSVFIYGPADHDFAKRVMTDALSRFASAWPDRPSVLAQLWNSDLESDVLQVIDVAANLYTLSHSLTSRSVEFFGEKVRLLLNARGQQEYEDLLTELTIGALFGRRAGPISIEPKVPSVRSSKPPSSPDFAVRRPDGDILIEVTTLRADVLDRWERAMDDIKSRLSAVANAGVHVIVSAPWGIRTDKLDRPRMRSLVEAMLAVEGGVRDLELGGAVATFEWRKIQMLEIPPGKRLADVLGDVKFPAEVVAYGPPGAKVVAEVQVKLTGPDDHDEETILKSLQNILNRKKEQMKGDDPAFLAIRLPNQLGANSVSRLIDRRIWPYKKYRWLAGVGVYRGRASFARSAELPNLIVTFNPSAEHSAPQSFKDLVGANPEIDSQAGW